MDSKQKKDLLNRTAPREEKLSGRTGKDGFKAKERSFEWNGSARGDCGFEIRFFRPGNRENLKFGD
jgi:hypothetical protein